jgi:hypothetical protein
VVAIPGPVILLGGPDGRRLPEGWAVRHRYHLPKPDPKYPKYFDTRIPTFVSYYTHGGGISPVQGNSCKVLDIKPGTAELTQDLILEPASALTVEIRDPEGRPLTGAWVTGLSAADWNHASTCKTGSCMVYGVEPGKVRLLVLYEPKRKLAAALTLRGDEKTPLTVTLRPAGTLKGRLLDEEGNPLASVVVTLRYKERVAREVYDAVQEARETVTDASGRFTMTGVLTGLSFEVAYQQGRRKYRLVSKPADPTVQVKSGEVLGLGDVKLERDPAEGGE